MIFVGNEVKLTMVDRASSGDAFAYLDNKKIFVAKALIGEEILVRITQVNPTFALGKIVKIIRSSPNRMDSFCNNECGGCTYTVVNYKHELEEKKQGLKKLYEGTKYEFLVGNAPIIGMSYPFNYRNKAVYACSYNSDKLTIGLYARGTHSIVPICACKLEAIWMKNVKNIIHSMFSLELNSEAANLRYIFLRGEDAGEKMCVLVFAQKPKFSTLEALKELAIRINITSLKVNINGDIGNRIFGKEFILVYGTDTIETKILGSLFRINAESFLQVNSSQASVLYQIALKLLSPSKDEVLVDLYCGAGTISLYAKSFVKQVIGIECVSSAVEDARYNAKLNGCDNVEFRCGLVEEVFPKLRSENITIDCVILDPARKGCEPSVFKTLDEFNVKRFVYISCNPKTQKRDVEIANSFGYSMIAFEAVDMFPHTEHVETVVLLSREK